MKFGLKTIAIKNIISLRENLTSATTEYKEKDKFKMPYSEVMSVVLGIDGE